MNTKKQLSTQTIIVHRVLQMRERGMRAIAPLCKHSDDKADAVTCEQLSIPAFDPHAKYSMPLYMFAIVKH